jgi:Mg2+-importing ATPase
MRLTKFPLKLPFALRTAQNALPTSTPEGEQLWQRRLPIADVAAKSVEEVLLWSGTSPEGLSDEQAKARLDQYGPNEVADEKPPRWYIQLLKR